MQKILIISHVIFPRISPRSHRATELAKELARQGHDVTLCACLGKYDYTDFEKEYHIKVKDLGTPKFVPVLSDPMPREIATWRKLVNRMLKKWFSFPSCLIGLNIRKFLKKSETYDRIISIALPYAIHWGTGYAVRHYKHLQNAVWISDCGDPYMGNPFQHHPFYFKWIEKKWSATTDYIAVPVKSAIDAYYPEFRNKIEVIPQGFSFDNVRLPEYEPNPIPTFAYSGAVYPNVRDPRPLLDFLVKLKTDFKFIVYAPSGALFDSYQSLLGDKLEIRSYVPHDQLLYELGKMDFLINIQNESPVQVPSKLIDYYMTKRPILNISSSFEQVKSMEEFLQHNYQDQYVFDDPDQYDIKNVARRFLSLKK